MQAGPQGLLGTVVHRVRGGAAPGEVRVVVDGLPHTYIAYAEDPLPVGAPVLVVHVRGARQVDVVPWALPGADDDATTTVT